MKSVIYECLLAACVKVCVVAMSSVTEVDAESLVRTHSPVGATAAAADGDDAHHPLRRMFSASLLSSLLGMITRLSMLLRC